MASSGIWPKPQRAELPITVVTACDGAFRDSALNLVGSVQHRSGAVDKVLVYDLGMTVGDRRRFRGIPGVRVRRVSPFCDHWRQCWTWKPWVWADAAASARRLLYLDAGVEIVGDLAPILSQLDDCGYFVLNEYFAHPAGHTIRQVTPAAYFAELSFDRALANRPVISAGIVGFDVGSRFHEKVVTQSLELSRRGYNLGWSAGEAERNKGIHRLDPWPLRDCELFRHDQTILSLVFHSEFTNPVIQSRQHFPSGHRSPRPGDVLWQHRRRARLQWIPKTRYTRLRLFETRVGRTIRHQT
jgi:hypothetical protein